MTIVEEFEEQIKGVGVHNCIENEYWCHGYVRLASIIWEGMRARATSGKLNEDENELFIKVGTVMKLSKKNSEGL